MPPSLLHTPGACGRYPARSDTRAYTEGTGQRDKTYHRPLTSQHRPHSAATGARERRCVYGTRNEPTLAERSAQEKVQSKDEGSGSGLRNMQGQTWSDPLRRTKRRSASAFVCDRRDQTYIAMAGVRILISEAGSRGLEQPSASSLLLQCSKEQQDRIRSFESKERGPNESNERKLVRR